LRARFHWHGAQQNSDKQREFGSHRIAGILLHVRSFLLRACREDQEDRRPKTAEDQMPSALDYLPDSG
jgi:hypothetical protein